MAVTSKATGKAPSVPSPNLDLCPTLKRYRGLGNVEDYKDQYKGADYLADKVADGFRMAGDVEKQANWAAGSLVRLKWSL